DHITKFPPAARDVESVTAIATGPAKPVITAPPTFRGRPGHPEYDGPAQEAEECDDILKEVSGGTGKVTLEQYFHYFNVTDEHSRRGNAIADMFHERDLDGDGVLTKEEIEQML
ncbi:MAG: hypothetical protein M1823_008431, partial [Watsoniomyces obsoletus]